MHPPHTPHPRTQVDLTEFEEPDEDGDGADDALWSEEEDWGL